jgi:hypothetical protein
VCNPANATTSASDFSRPFDWTSGFGEAPVAAMHANPIGLRKGGDISDE